MQTTLFRALQGINIPDDQAENVVEQLEGHVEAVVNNNIKAVLAQIAEVKAGISQLEGRLEGKIAQLEAKFEGKIAQLEAKLEGKIAQLEGRIIAVEGKLVAVQMTLDSMRGQIQLMTVMLGVIGLAIAAGPIVSRFVH
jgi:chromosome segregation ATPase